MNISSKTKNYIKYNLKKVICPLLFYSGYFNYKLNRMKNKAVILMYHRVTKDEQNIAVTKDNFELQMKYIKKKMNPVTLMDIVEWIKNGKPIPPKAIAITFDDGYEDNYTNAYPILKTLSIPATIFLTTGYIETSKIFWWDKVREIIKKTNKKVINMKEFQRFTNKNINSLKNIKLIKAQGRTSAIRIITEYLKTIDYNKLSEATKFLQEILDVSNKDIEIPPMLTWEQINEMSGNGIDFGAHTVTHPNLTKISIEEVEKEIHQSKRTIEERLNTQVNNFAYPYGLKEFYNKKIEGIAKSLGFNSICTGEPGVVTGNSDVSSLKRVSMSDVSLPDFLWKMCKYLR
jgi:peptidoglycan/xylan/chitin deacetylase (PgdA/CDA1 family)